ncbi:MAG: hypothetical protein LC798_15375 [Chloroflexi bacterium]|nr:hypothetical protein [Chloroflexota bacterium]
MSTAAVPQNMTALAKANTIRIGRSALRLQVAAGEVRAVDVLADPPACTHTLTVAGLLGWQHRWGDDRTRRVLVRAGVRETQTLAALTDRQRARVARAMGDLEAAASILGREREAAEKACRCEYDEGPCVRTREHDGPCVVATFLGTELVYRTADTGRVVHRTDATVSRTKSNLNANRLPGLPQIRAWFAAVEL